MSTLLTNRQIKSYIKQTAASHRACVNNGFKQISASKDPNQISRLSQITAQHSLIKGALDQLLQDIEELENSA